MTVIRRCFGEIRVNFSKISLIIHIEIAPGLVYTKRKNPCIVRDGLSFEPTLFIREFLSFRSLQAPIYRGSGKRKGKYPPVQDRYKTRLNGKGGDLFMSDDLRFLRFSSLIGEENFENLVKKHIVIFGIGGVGSFVAEALARAGVGKLTLVDFDTVAVHNINRQILALSSTVGQEKAEVMKKRVLDINPRCEVVIRKDRATPENIDSYFEDVPDFVADAIDDVPAKTSLILHCLEKGYPLISAMGTGNKMHPEMLEISDIEKTEVCPLCRSVRRKLRERGIKRGVTVVYSREIPHRSDLKENGHPVPASSPFVPSSAGILMASYIVNRFLSE